MHDSEYISLVNSMIDDFENSFDSYNSYLILWDFCKMAIAYFLKEYSKEKNKEERENYRNAKNKIEIIEGLPKPHLNYFLIDQLETYKKVVIKYNEKQRRGSMLRSKLVNFEENEVDISYLSRIEKLRGESNSVTSLFDKNGTLVEDSEQILNVVYDFYSDLYKKEPEDLFEQNFFLSHIDKKLTIEDKNYIDRPFEKDELFEYLKSLKGNKSLGDDGLTTKLYLFFWEKFSSLYMKCLTEIRENKSLSAFQERGLIIINYKKNVREF